MYDAILHCVHLQLLQPASSNLAQACILCDRLQVSEVCVLDNMSALEMLLVSHGFSEAGLTFIQFQAVFSDRFFFSNRSQDMAKFPANSPPSTTVTPPARNAKALSQPQFFHSTKPRQPCTHKAFHSPRSSTEKAWRKCGKCSKFRFIQQVVLGKLFLWRTF